MGGDGDAKVDPHALMNMEKVNPDNPVVFFDVSMGDQALGRIKIELFKNIAPRTCENFRQFCIGHRQHGVPIGYKHASFHRVIKDFMIQLGDFIKQDGTGLTSIYSGSAFADENFTLKHTKAGVLSMANSGPGTNGCQFFITCSACDFLDGKHVVFGRVVEGMLTVRKIENVPTDSSNRPKVPVVITECGEM